MNFKATNVWFTNKGNRIHLPERPCCAVFMEFEA